jgi:hypothetical protein
MLGQESAPSPPPPKKKGKEGVIFHETSQYFVFPEIYLNHCEASKTLVEIANSSYVHIYNDNFNTDVREFSFVFSPNSFFCLVIIFAFLNLGNKQSAFSHFLAIVNFSKGFFAHENGFSRK